MSLLCVNKRPPSWEPLGRHSEPFYWSELMGERRLTVLFLLNSGRGLTSS